MIVGALVAAVLYFGSFLFPWSYSQAVLVLVSIAFLAVLGIGAWIGWTMASTPSPEPVEDMEEEFDEEFDEIEEEPDLDLGDQDEGPDETEKES